jgi:hypothetical protein
MAGKPDNVVLTKAAAAALSKEFVRWQCRIRQFAVRMDGGRPSAGMRPRVTAPAGEEISGGVIVLISETEPENTTEQFRYQYLKTQDPNERYDKMLEFLQGRYFQEPARFSDVMTALFAKQSELSRRLLELERCVLEFDHYNQGYRIPCAVSRLAPTHPRHLATYWHNRNFSDRQPASIEVLAFTPDWAHSKSFREDD